MSEREASWSMVSRIVWVLVISIFFLPARSPFADNDAELSGPPLDDPVAAADTFLAAWSSFNNEDQVDRISEYLRRATGSELEHFFSLINQSEAPKMAGSAARNLVSTVQKDLLEGEHYELYLDRLVSSEHRALEQEVWESVGRSGLLLRVISKMDADIYQALITRGLMGSAVAWTDKEFRSLVAALNQGTYEKKHLDVFEKIFFFDWEAKKKNGASLLMAALLTPPPARVGIALDVIERAPVSWQGCTDRPKYSASFIYEKLAAVPKESRREGEFSDKEGRPMNSPEKWALAEENSLRAAQAGLEDKAASWNALNAGAAAHRLANHSPFLAHTFLLTKAIRFIETTTPDLFDGWCPKTFLEEFDPARKLLFEKIMGLRMKAEKSPAVTEAVRWKSDACAEMYLIEEMKELKEKIRARVAGRSEGGGFFHWQQAGCPPVQVQVNAGSPSDWNRVKMVLPLAVGQHEPGTPTYEVRQILMDDPFLADWPSPGTSQKTRTEDED